MTWPVSFVNVCGELGLQGGRGAPRCPGSPLAQVPPRAPTPGTGGPEGMRRGQPREPAPPRDLTKGSMVKFSTSGATPHRADAVVVVGFAVRADHAFCEGHVPSEVRGIPKRRR